MVATAIFLLVMLAAMMTLLVVMMAAMMTLLVMVAAQPWAAALSWSRALLTPSELSPPTTHQAAPHIHTSGPGAAFLAV